MVNQGVTSLNIGKPTNGGHVSTGVSQHPGHGCCKRQAVSSARLSQSPWNRESCCRSSPPKSWGYDSSTGTYSILTWCQWAAS